MISYMIGLGSPKKQQNRFCLEFWVDFWFSRCNLPKWLEQLY